MIKAVAFDCFGVVVSDGWLSFIARYFGQNQAALDKAASLSVEVDTGKLSYDAFIGQVAELANVAEHVARQQIENNVVDQKLLGYIAELKEGYKVGLLANVGNNWLANIFTPEQLALFDATALSYEMGVTKPDSRAYETIAERLGVQPSECVFVDDQPKFVEGAERLGMPNLLYSNCEQLERDLPALLTAQ